MNLQHNTLHAAKLSAVFAIQAGCYLLLLDDCIFYNAASILAFDTKNPA